MWPAGIKYRVMTNPLPVRIEKLQTRRQFLAVAASGRRWVTKSFILQALPDFDSSGTVHVGFTTSKKLGNAVARNRARRRLREVARLALGTSATAGWAYVLVGRASDAERAFADMQADLAWAVAKLASGADLKTTKRAVNRKAAS